MIVLGCICPGPNNNNNDCRTGILIDVAIPADANILSKESENIIKNLCIELRRLCNLRTVNVIPIVISCLEAYTPNLLKFL